MRVRLPGMTLIELVVTLGIIGALAAFALPSMRGLQARSELKSSQQMVQSGLYRLQQLAVAPLETGSQDDPSGAYDIVGYGLLFMPIPRNNYLGTVTLQGCRVAVNNDFVALYKFARPQSGNSDIQPLVMPSSLNATPTNCSIKAKDYPNDFFVLPRGVRFGASTPNLVSPWLITKPLTSVGSQVGELRVSGTTNPFASADTVTLSLVNTKLKRGETFLCRTLRLNGASTAIEAIRTVSTCNETL